MSRKFRFTPDEKEKAVVDYIEGNKSRGQICEELCISTRTIQDWAAIYNKYGIIGFTRKTKNNSYSKEFKTKVVEEYIKGEGSSILFQKTSKSKNIKRNGVHRKTPTLQSEM